MRGFVRVVLPLGLLTLVAIGMWVAYTGSSAYSAIRDLETAVSDLRAAVDDADLGAVESAAVAAQDAAAQAADTLDDPVWAVLASIPYVGDSAEVARTSTGAVAIAADGLRPLLEASGVFDPGSFYVDGRVAIEKLEAAQAPLAESATAAAAAAAQVATAPRAADGAWVPTVLDAQRARAQQQLDEAAQALTTAAAAAKVLPSLLGADEERTWFVGVQSPGEARGTGGVIGTHVILTADDGRLALQRTASNSELGRLESLPDFGDQFTARYRGDPTFIANTNLSPHFPYAGRLWQEFYAQATGDRVDVVMGTDVVALGSLIEATGPLTLPDGRRITADQAVELALIGVYEEFPNNREREEFQEDVAEAVFTEVTNGAVPGPALVDALGQMVSEKRLQLWSPREEEQSLLLSMPTSGSVAAEPGPYAFPVLINATASKLDSFITRSIQYEIGRCEIAERVQSRLRVTVTSDIPEDVELPDYVIAQAERGPDGPISSTQLQIHLSPDAAIDDARVDGEPVAPYAFREEGRPALLLGLTLNPRRPVSVTVDFNEAASDLEATVPEQPLALPAQITTLDSPCSLPR